MSGPKTTYIRPSLSRQARQRLRHLLPALKTAAAAMQSADQRDHAGEVESLVKSLRHELQQFTMATDRRADALQALRTAEAMLRRYELANLARPSLQQLNGAIGSIEAALAGRPDLGINELGGHAESLLARTHGLTNVRDQLRDAAQAIRETIDHARSKPGGPVDRPPNTEQLDSRIRAALVGPIDQESRSCAEMPGDSVALGGFDRSSHEKLLTEARAHAQRGDADSTIAAIDAARALRERASHAGAELREQIEQRNDVAGRLAQALAARNYDAVQAYYKEGETGGDAAPLVLYASNPGGKAHVRMTLGIDGSMVVEVDGVAEGEEQVCLDVLGAFARAVSEAGDTLEIQDFGRASRVREPRALAKEREAKERQR